jgi:hypothetical protein
MQVTLTVPAGSPAGRIVVSGWMRYVITHISGTADRTIIYVGTSPSDCGASDSYRSYAAVPSAMPTASFEGMVPIQNQFLIPAGGGTFTFYLNTQRIPVISTSNASNFTDASANIEAVFHTQG